MAENLANPPPVTPAQADLFDLSQAGWQAVMQGYDGIWLKSPALPKSLADRWFSALSTELDWQHWQIKLYGRQIASPRLSCWHGDADCSYRYSNVQRQPTPWSPLLLQIRQWLYQQLIELQQQQPKLNLAREMSFNSVLGNLYQHGQHSMGWHSDNEPELGKQPLIASLSLGASRRFRLRPTAALPANQKRRSTAIELPHGSLLIMCGNSQADYQHSLPKTAANLGPRINLTFRQIISH